MSPVQPTAWLENRQDHTAQTLRNALAGLSTGFSQGATNGAGGVHPTLGGRLNVTGTADMHVSVDTGLVYMPASTAWNGFYAGFNNGAYLVGPLSASSATQFRSDLICARQHDSQNGDPDDNWDIIFVTGTFSSTSPAPVPAAPNNAVPLAVVNVTPNMTATNGTGAITDARQYIPLSGPIPTTSANKPPVNSPEGTMWFEGDTNQLGIIINNAYSYVVLASGGSWLPITSIKPADTSRASNTTVTNDPDLQLSLAANISYKIEAVIFYDGGSGTSEGDLKWQWSLPTGAVFQYGHLYQDASGSIKYLFEQSAGDSLNAVTGGTGAGSQSVIHMYGIYVGGNTAGTLAFQWAQNTSKSTGTRVKQYSFVSAQRIA